MARDTVLVLQRSGAVCRSDFEFHFAVCVQLRLIFTRFLFIVNLHYIFRHNWLPSNVQVVQLP
jgi:hypothetical protein